MENKSRIEKIDAFLKYLAKISEQNPGYQFNTDSVYRMITRSGVSKEDARYSINENDFSKWINTFSNSQNMRVFVSDYWKYFCQFVTKDKNEYSKLVCSSNHIKLYIPVDGKHIQESARLIFDFISKNNISHASKIGSDIRCDDIVIRLLNPDDAKKVMEFVKNNKYIQEGLIDSNPFTPSVNGVSFVCDGSLSYNDTMARLVSNYINGLRKDKRLSSASFDDFKKYVELYERYLFESNIADYSLCSRHPSFQGGGMFNNIKDVQDVYSLRGVFDLFNMSVEKDFSLDKYFELYENLLNPDEYYKKEEKPKTDNKIDEVSTKVRVLMDVMSKKYGEDVALRQVATYFDTGRDTLITRDYGLRTMLQNGSFRQNVLNRANSEGTTTREFVSETAKKKRSKEDYLMDACFVTYMKYEDLHSVGQSDKDGVNWAGTALYSLIRKNNYNGFTRDIDARGKLFSNVSADEALSILSSKLGVSVEELSVMDKEQFKNVCKDFVKKVAGIEEVTEKVYG